MAYNIKSTGRTGNANLLFGGKISIGAQADLGSITFKCNRLHYNYFAIFMITLHYDYINFQM